MPVNPTSQPAISRDFPECEQKVLELSRFRNASESGTKEPKRDSGNQKFRPLPCDSGSMVISFAEFSKQRKKLMAIMDLRMRTGLGQESATKVIEALENKKNVLNAHPACRKHNKPKRLPWLFMMTTLASLGIYYLL